MRWGAAGVIAWIAACGAPSPPVHPMSVARCADGARAPSTDGGDVDAVVAETAAVHDAAGARIERVTVRGPAALADASLDAAVTTKVGDAFDVAQVREDVRRLWRLGVVDQVRVAVARERTGGVAVAFEVDASPLVRHVSVHVPSGPDGDRDTWAARVRALGGAIYDPMRTYRVAHRLEEELKSTGHLKARVALGVTRAGPGLVDVCVVAAAGPRYTIARIQFPGAERLEHGALLALLRRDSGDIDAPGGAYRAEMLAEDLPKIDQAYYDAGMVMVKVGEPVVAIDERRASLVVSVPIDEGAVFHVGRIAMKGVAAGDEPTYRRELKVATGEIFARGALATGIDRLRSLERDRGRSGDVTPLTAIDVQRHVIDLTIEVGK